MELVARLIIQRPFLRSLCNLSKPCLSTQKPDPLTQVISILETSTFIEPSLDPIAHIINPNIVASVIMKPPNFQLGFRFYIWALKFRSFRAWEVNHFLLDLILQEDRGFDLCWETVEEVSKCGLEIPSEVFKLLIFAYWKVGNPEKAVESFGKMKDFNCCPDVHTYNTILYIMVQKEMILLAMSVYNQMCCSPNVATYSILIDCFCKRGNLEDALTLFDEMRRNGILPNVITYTIVLSGLCHANKIHDAQCLLNEMTKSGCRPDGITCDAMLSGICKADRIDEAFALLDFLRNQGYTLGIKGYSCLIDGLFRARRFEEADLWFRKLCDANITPDLVLYTIMIRGFLDAGKVKDAWKFVQEMTDRGVHPDTQCYNALIKGLCDMSLFEDAHSLKLEISKNNCLPNTYTYTILLCGAFKKGLVGEAKQIFEEMDKVGCFPSVVTYNTLIDGLCKAGEHEEARIMLYKMEIGRTPSLFLRLSQGTDRAPDKESLQNLIARLSDSGLYLKAYRLLTKLIDNGVLPNTTTYNILINSMCKAGNINGAYKLFKELQLKGLSPDSVTYGTLIDGLYRADREEDAIFLLKTMMDNGCTPQPSIFKTMMTWSCRKRKFSVSFSLWLEYLRSHKNWNDVALKTIKESFDLGHLEEAVRGLLNLDSKSNNFDAKPYTILLIGLCQVQRVDEALKTFKVLQEYNVIVTPPSCVKLIRVLCLQSKLDQAIDVFLYTLNQRFILSPTICNRLLCSLFRSETHVKYAIHLLGRMDSVGYDLDLHLLQRTKSLWQHHSNVQESMMAG